ncbi:farnesol dehydrogenase-like isoform X2 [Condylostylus longicornis]|nr:farnesol dehydrogenase-like isoform X2 [Condylostylus longicornis]
MERWYNKLAIVTGADQNIGCIIADALVNKGLIVMGLAENIDNVLKIRSELPTTLRHRLYPIRCDITKDDQVEKAFSYIQNTYGCIDMLINCAGILYGNILKNNGILTNENIKKSLDCNINGIKNCTERAYINMKNRMADGHIILIDSLLGNINTKLLSYSKDVITELTETYRNQFINDGINNVKITCILSGPNETGTVSSNLIRQTLNYPILKENEISNVILYAVSTPPMVEIHEIILKTM